MPLSLRDATKVIDAAHVKALHLGVKVTAAVVDEGGHLVALGRMDGAPPLSPKSRRRKRSGRRCSTATVTHWPSWPRTGPASSARPIAWPAYRSYPASDRSRSNG